jgi:hypothetical protein
MVPKIQQMAVWKMQFGINSPLETGMKNIIQEIYWTKIFMNIFFFILFFICLLIVFINYEKYDSIYILENYCITLLKFIFFIFHIFINCVMKNIIQYIYSRKIFMNIFFFILFFIYLLFVLFFFIFFFF